MVVETGDGHYGLAVDEVLGNHQTVIKNLGRLYRDVATVSGATILGNGTVALILDPHRLVQNAIQAASQDQRSGARRSQRDPGPRGQTPTHANAFMRKEHQNDVK
jgi:two-component system chemotaxis sensor kinase CheA